MNPRFLMIADPVSQFDRGAETSFFLLKELTQRNVTSFIATLPELFLKDGEVRVRASAIRVSHADLFSYELGEPREESVASFDCVLLRKDPPVDTTFIDHLTLLELVELADDSPLFINSPHGLKKAAEKIYPHYFPGISPPTLIAMDPDLLAAFAEVQGLIVLKPLNQAGGRGVQLVPADDRNLRALLESATLGGSKYTVAQKFIPEARTGDKRILLFNGGVIGAFLRVPKPGDFRGNLHSGAHFTKTSITPHEQALVERLTPQLSEDGLIFVGLDVIGSYVTEVNVTSPMGIRELNALTGSSVEIGLVDALLTLV